MANNMTEEKTVQPYEIGELDQYLFGNGTHYELYKKMGAPNSVLYEKVLILGLERLEEVKENLFEYLQINPYDDECPLELKKSLLNSQENMSMLEIERDKRRKRTSTSRMLRDSRFRANVLEAYGNMCAICRCEEEKILEAAHIVAVAEGGNDDVENGICLCANHHRMLDKGKIKIDFDNLTLFDISENVKKMAWYDAFMKVHRGKIISRR